MNLRRLVWVGPLTVLASIVAVVLVRAAVVTLLHPEPAFLPLTVTPAILDTAVFVILGVFVFRRVLSGGGLPGPLQALIGERFFTLDGMSAFRLVAFRALLISFLPDVGIAVSTPQHWEYSLALAAMHVAAWAVTVSMLTTLIKTRQTQGAGRVYR